MGADTAGFLENHIWIVFGTSATFYWPEPGTRRPGFESREQAEGTAKDLWLFFFNLSQHTLFLFGLFPNSAGAQNPVVFFRGVRRK